MSRRGINFKPRGGWSLGVSFACDDLHGLPFVSSPIFQGFKRNLCCHLSRGAIIAHFDDDDLCPCLFGLVIKYGPIKLWAQ